MDFFRKVGNFFSGVFNNNDDDEEKRRREAEAARTRATQTQNFQRQVQQPQVQNVNQFFGNKQQPQQNQEPEKPKPQPTQINQAPKVFNIQQYENPGVQDVNGYYANDLKVLKEEIAKGANADEKRIRGIMQSLDNRKKELQEFHNERGKAQSFKSARNLEKKIKDTRGDWTKQNEKLSEFWSNVSAQEKDDFINFLNEKRFNAQTQGVDTPSVTGFTDPVAAGLDWRRKEDFSEDTKTVEAAKAEQANEDFADELLQKHADVPLSEFGNRTVKEIYDGYNRQDASARRADVLKLAEAIENPKNEDQKNQAIALFVLLDKRGDKSTKTVDKVGSFSTTATDKLFGGLFRGALRGVDYAVPGVDTLGTGKLREAADVQDTAAQKERELLPDQKLADAGAIAGSVAKGGVDIGTMLIPAAGAEKFIRGSQIAGRIANTGRVGQTAVNIGANVGSGVPASVIDAVQQAGRGDDPDFLKAGLTGAGVDLLIGGLEGRIRPLNRIRQLFGRGTEEAIGTAATAAGKTDIIEEAVETIPGRKGTVGEIPNDFDTEEITELRKIAEDLDSSPGSRAQAKAKLAELEAEAADRAAREVGAAETPLDRPTFQHNQDIQKVIDDETAKLEKYINENPNLTIQELEAVREAAKKRTIELVEKLQANRFGTEQVVAKQGDEIAANEAAQQATNAEVAAAQAAKTTPPAGEVVEASPAPANPELAANRPTTEEVLFNDAPGFDERNGLNLWQKASPDRIIREKVTRPLLNQVDRGIAALQQSDNKVLQPLGRFFTGFSREAGVDPATQTARMQLRGGVESGKVYRESIADLSKGMSKESTDKVWASLDPEQAARVGIEQSPLNEVEQALQEKLITLIDNTTAENLRRGLITPEQASASYIKRAYTLFDGADADVSQFERGFRQELLSQYKGRKQVSDEMIEQAITDPTYLVGKKAAESQAVWAMQDYGNYLAKSNVAVDAPRRGYTQLPDSAVFGEAAGKYVPQNLAEDFTGFRYSTAMVSAMNDVITAYDRWGLRQAKKQLLTVFNPAVRLGNQVTNRGIFAQLGGINPLQFNKAYFDAGAEIANNGQLYREAVEQGLTGVDITQAEFFAQRIANAGDKNLARQAADWVKTSYSAADDKARVAAYMVHRNRGYSPEEAARLTQRGFQDYKSVGFFYDMAAKTPIVGNAFVRFVADSIRIAKNAAVDHPLRSAATVALWSTFVNGMSVASGESELQGDDVATQAFNLATGKSKSEDQKAREDRFGAPKLPFTDISTAVQTPWGEVNVARFMPWYQLSGINDEGVNAATKFLPISQSPVEIRDGKLAINPQAMQDPVLGQLVQLGVDEDFRGKSIRDPGNEDGKFRRDPLSAEDQWKNVARFLAVNNLPFGREVDQTASAATGNPDLYGKERNIWQAMARNLGFKVENYGKEQIEDSAAMTDWYEEKAQIEQELEGMSPDAQEAYRRLTGYDKLREMVPNEFEPGTDRYKKAPVYDFGEDKWKDYAAHPEIYQLMVDKKKREQAEDGKPIQPEFDERLSESFRKQLIQNKMVAPGDDAELDQRMYSSPEWDYYQTLKDQYGAEAAKYYPKSDGEFVDELVKHQDAKFPEKPTVLKTYGALYGLYADGKTTEKPEFTDEIKAAKEQYNRATLDWTNNERKARGLPAITWEVWNNPTFGFDATASDDSYGYGGGGGGGSTRPYDTNVLGDLTNFTATVKGYDPIKPGEMPNIAQLFQRLQAGSKGNRKKPQLGAASRGQS